MSTTTRQRVRVNKSLSVNPMRRTSVEDSDALAMMALQSPSRVRRGGATAGIDGCEKNR